MSEKFSLRWTDFKSMVSNSFGILRQEKDFFDVTLVSDDERQIPAHKLVLSACSDFFKSILRNNSHSHPLLYLSGIHSTNLSLILDYIYQGEVQIYEDHLDSFMEVARRLKIEGLLNVVEETHKSDVKNEDYEYYEELDTTDDIFNEADYAEKENVDLRGKNQPKQDMTEGDNSGVNERIQENLGKEDGVYHCKLCGYKSVKKTHVALHIETHIEGLSYSCSVCDKTFRTRLSQRKHISRNHKF